VKRILLQLDTEEHPSPFDAIVAHDADVDVLLSHGNVTRDDARALAQDAFFTRGPDDLKNTAIWVGGKHVGTGEEIFAEVQKAFFGPFKVSVMPPVMRSALTVLLAVIVRDVPSETFWLAVATERSPDS